MKKLFTFLLIIFVVGGATFVLYFKPLRLGLDLQGGMRIVLEASDTEFMKVDSDAVIGALEVIRNRVDRLGVSEPVVRRKGFRQIVLELPGIKDPERALRLIGETALLEFSVGEWLPGDISNLSDEKKRLFLGDQGRLSEFIDYDKQGEIVNKRYVALKETVLTGADLKSAEPSMDQFGQPVISISFSLAGGKTFYAVTSKFVGQPLFILLDGKIISAPNINEPISGGQAQISGQFSPQEIKDLVIKLKAGALPVPVEVISNRVVGPTLGQDAVLKSKIAFIIGLLMICLYMILVYRIPGFISVVALVIYLIVSLALLKLFDATLTLPGIAGFILTIGMAVDANVIIFERIYEESLHKGQSLIDSVKLGFAKAFRAIIDANVTTLFAAIVLFWLGTGSIKGFAVTLTIGILVSMFSAIVVTNFLLTYLVSFLVRKKIYLFR